MLKREKETAAISLVPYVHGFPVCLPGINLEKDGQGRDYQTEKGVGEIKEYDESVLDREAGMPGDG